jgi:hypothetical protein
MKKILSKEALAKEAAFWRRMSQAVKEHPGRLCHK